MKMIKQFWQGKSFRQRVGNVLFVLYIPLMVFIIGQELREYWRLPDEPTRLTTAAAIKLADQGARPLVQLTDATWDCDRLLIVHGKRNSTNVALKTPATEQLIIVKFWGNGSCAGLANKTMAGVLQPIGNTRYGVLKNDGFHLAPYTDSQQVYELCGFCSRQYSLSELQQIAGILVVAIVLTAGGQIWRRIRPASPLSPLLPSQPPVICSPTWLNGKICLDAPLSHFQQGAMLEISYPEAGQEDGVEQFYLQANGRGSHLLAGGHQGSMPGNRMMNDVVPPETVVTLTIINPNGMRSIPIAFQR